MDKLEGTLDVGTALITEHLSTRPVWMALAKTCETPNELKECMVGAFSDVGLGSQLALVAIENADFVYIYWHTR